MVLKKLTKTKKTSLSSKSTKSTKSTKKRLSNRKNDTKNDKSEMDVHQVIKDNIDHIGILDPEGVNINPLTGKEYQNIYKKETKTISGEVLPSTYSNLSKIWVPKLVYKNRHQIIDGIRDNQIVLATAGTGVGKTLLIPKLALHALEYQKKVIVCLPKKIITKNTAEFAARTLDVAIGEEVGYYYKGTRVMDNNGKKSMLIFTTIGSLISRITGNDPELVDYGCVILDEAHETTVSNTLTLLLMKKALMKRKDLKFIIMSATINLEIFHNYYPKKDYKFKEIDAGTETSYKIKDLYLNGKPLDWYSIATEIAFKLLKTNDEGDIVIFGKAGGDSNKICTSLDKEINNHNKNKDKKEDKNKDKNDIILFCTKLASGITTKDERLATDEKAYMLEVNSKGSNYNRKVVVSTNVGESSITIDNVKFVIDSGLQYESSFNPLTMVRYLLETEISQSSISQRRGRTGRTAPGSAFHLYSEKDEKSRPKYPTPEVQKSDLTEIMLDLMRLKYINNVKDLKVLLNEFITQPSDKFVNSSLRTLRHLHAISSDNNDGIMTSFGKAITQFRGVRPQFSRTIIYSYFYNCSREICDIIAISIISDGRMNMIFEEFKPDKKKADGVNKKAEKEYNQIRKSMTHKLGDYMTCYTAYQTYLNRKNRGNPTNNDSTNNDSNDSNDSNKDSKNNGFDDSGIIIENEDNQVEFTTEIKYNKSQRLLKKWCKDNYLKFNKLQFISNTSKQLRETLKKLIRTKALRDIKVPDLPKEIINLDDKIMATLAIGASTNIAKLTSGDIYIPCFPIEPLKCRFDMNTTLKSTPEYVLFDELFSNNMNSKYVKLNMVTTIPSNIVKLLKGNKDLSSCFNEEKFKEYKKKKTFKKEKRQGMRQGNQKIKKKTLKKFGKKGKKLKRF